MEFTEVKKSLITGGIITLLVFIAMAIGRPSYDTSMIENACSYEFNQINSSTEEYNLPYVSIKLEHSKGIAKLKLKGAFETFEWDYVNVNQKPGSIIAAVEKNDTRDVVAQLLALDKKSGKIDWALFYKPLGAELGFYLRQTNDKLTCAPASIDQWIGELRSISGGMEFTKKRLVGPAPGTVYEQFGLLGL